MFMQVKVLFLLLLLLLVFALVTMTSSSPNAKNMTHNIQIIRSEQRWKATVALIDSSTDHRHIRWTGGGGGSGASYFSFKKATTFRDWEEG